MNRLLSRVVIGWLGAMLFVGCSGPEEKAGKLLTEALQLVRSAQEAEKTSYPNALALYQQVLAKAETIPAQYPSSQLAGKLAQGEVRIGPYTITELKDTIVPQAKMKTEAEESPLACALLVASRIPPSTLIVGTDEVLDARPEVVAKIVDKYAQAEQCTQVLQVARMTGVPFPKDWMFTEIAHKCAAAGQYAQAFAAATTLENAYTKATALAEIANSYAQAGQKEKAAEMLSQSLQIAGTLKDNTALLTEMARKFAQAGQYDQAVQIAKTIEDGHVRADLLVEIAYSCMRADQYDQALKAAKELEDDGPSKANVLAEIVRKYVKVGQYDQALQVAHTIPHPYSKAGVLAEVANKYVEAGQKEKISEILSQALQAANTQSAYFRVATLVAVASTYTAVGQKEKALELLSQALQVANSVGDTSGVFPSNATALEAIAGAVAEAGLYDQALEIADTIKGTAFPVAPQVFLGVVYKYAAAGQYDRAVEVAEATIQEVPSKTTALVEIAGKCIEAGQKEKAAEIASRALQAAQAIEDDSFRIWKLDEIADIYTKADQREKAAEPLSQALQVVQTIKDSKVKAGALTGIALKYAAAGYSDQALELTKTMMAAETAESLTYILVEIVHEATQVEQYDHALQVTRTIPDAYMRARVLAEIARRYMEAGFYEQAIEVAKSITGDAQLKEQVLAEIAGKYAQAGYYDQALQIARRIEIPPFFQSTALTEIARAYVESGHYDQALHIAEIMPMATSKASVLAEVAGKYAEASQKEKTAEILFQALQVAKTAEDASAKAETLATIGFQYAKIGLQADSRAKQVLHEIIAGLYGEARHEQPSEAEGKKKPMGPWGLDGVYPLPSESR